MAKNIFREDIKLIKGGEKGFGLLVEQDAGYISPTEERNLPFINEINKLPNQGKIMPDPLVVVVVLQKYDVKNLNGRIYGESILKAQAQEYQKLIEARAAVGELDHPESSIIAGDRISHNITKIWWENATLMGEMEIIMSPGFTNYGIVSTKGDEVANLLRNRIRIGVSSRGVGSLEEDRQGNAIVQDDFELICWDVVTAPSTPGSYIFNNREESKPFVESKNRSGNLLSGGLDRFLLK